MLALLIVGCGALGLAVGSFLNVVIYRVPRRQSVVAPRSACPSCGASIASRDNIPVVSWLLLKGRCRKCDTPISVRYPLVEFVTGSLFAGAAARLGFDGSLPAFLILLAGLVALSFIDVESLLLPKEIVYSLLGLVAFSLEIAAMATGQWHRLFVAALCGLAWFLLFFAINFANPKYLGFGDVRLAPVLGLALGWLGIRYVLLGFFAANLLGAVIGIFLIATKRMARDQQIPYGVFLAIGTALAIFAGPALLSPFRTIS